MDMASREKNIFILKTGFIKNVILMKKIINLPIDLLETQKSDFSIAALAILVV